MLAGCRSVPRDVPPIELKKGSTVRIVLPAEENAQLQKAAVLIQKRLERSGVKTVVEAEGRRYAFKGTTVFLGNTRAFRGIGFDPGEMKSFHAVIATRGGDIFIAGRDRDPSETLAGAAFFADEHLTVRPLSAGKKTEPVKKEYLLIPENLSFRVPLDWGKKKIREKEQQRKTGVKPAAPAPKECAAPAGKR